MSVLRSFFSQNFERKSLGFNVDLWKGFYVSVRPSEMGFNLNVDGLLDLINFLIYLKILFFKFKLQIVPFLVQQMLLN